MKSDRGPSVYLVILRNFEIIKPQKNGYKILSDASKQLKKMEILLFYRVYEPKFTPPCQYLDVKRSHVSLGVPITIQVLKGIFF